FVDPNHVAELMADPVKLADELCLVGFRPDNETYWVLDGQHHVAAALLCGARPMLCRVFDSDGWKTEAQVYRNFIRAHTQDVATDPDQNGDGITPTVVDDPTSAAADTSVAGSVSFEDDVDNSIALDGML
ncbi:MAG TPA: hypothetical protein VMT43_06610, partial [Acidimicrobiales bacterium]|nr:hypothetical protein [Acidimicrobiales bacterium]